MANRYLSFISDEHFLGCISNLYDSYNKAKGELSKAKFYKNKVDTVKLIFDSKFNDASPEEIIETEILRQIDKSINNSIGTFHEQILGGVEGYEVGQLSGFDIKAKDNSLFADIKNKHNTMNSSAAESLYQKLARYADTHKHAKCYWVQVLSKGSFNESWHGDINGKEYNHSRVYKISGDQFYALITGESDALYKLYKALPTAISEFLDTVKVKVETEKGLAFKEISKNASLSSREIFDQITFENYGYYLGFDKL